MTVVRPWQVWWVDFDPQVGREQAKLRPAIVVGTKLACDLPNDLAIVIPCTHTNRGLPWHPAIGLGDNESFAMCDQIKSVSMLRLRNQHKDREITSTVERESIARALRELVTVDV